MLKLNDGISSNRAEQCVCVCVVCGMSHSRLLTKRLSARVNKFRVENSATEANFAFDQRKYQHNFVFEFFGRIIDSTGDSNLHSALVGAMQADSPKNKIVSQIKSPSLSSFVVIYISICVCVFIVIPSADRSR